VLNAVVGTVATALVAVLGFKATSSIRQKLWSMYGNGELGGKQYSNLRESLK